MRDGDEDENDDEDEDEDEDEGSRGESERRERMDEGRQEGRETVTVAVWTKKPRRLPPS